MSYIRQPQLITYDALCEQYDDNSRLLLILRALPDERLLAWLARQRAGRRNEYPQEVLWRCLIAKAVYQIGTYAGLIRELSRNESLRRVVGIDNPKRVPGPDHLSRFVGRLASAEGLERLAGLFETLVARLGELFPQLGRHLAVDGTALHAYSNTKRRAKSDADAAWGARTKRRQDGQGQAQARTEYWFGYLAHLVVDCETELPVAWEVTGANVAETTRLVPLLEGLAERQPEVEGRLEAVIADAGYDSQGNCAHVLRREALPIIKLRRTLKGDELCQAAQCCCTELGTPVCPSGHKMTYWGRDGKWLKWRCPVACGEAERCTAFGRCSASEYGTVAKIDIWEDPRRFPGLARESGKWERLYRQRTAAERVNSRLKQCLGLDELTVRGLAKVRAHVGVGLIVLLGAALAMAQAGQAKRVRRIVTLAAA
jgi:IS5 family transposase